MARTENLDRLIRDVYGLVVGDVEACRTAALRTVCMAFGAHAAAWLTATQGSVCGEFSQWPPMSGHDRKGLAALSFPPEREELVYEIPAAAAYLPNETAFALRLRHPDSHLTNVVLMRFARAPESSEREALRRALAHMVEASSLALRLYVQRDEWLSAMGRANRGAAALVDRGGALYAASGRFRELVGGGSGDASLQRLPCKLPSETLGEAGGTFVWKTLRLRVAPHGEPGNLYLLHVRPPLLLDSLSSREHKIARALGAGKSFKTVAREQGLATSTVANHATRIYRKLGVFRREDLVQEMRKSGAGRAA